MLQDGVRTSHVTNEDFSFNHWGGTEFIANRMAVPQDLITGVR